MGVLPSQRNKPERSESLSRMRWGKRGGGGGEAGSWWHPLTRYPKPPASSDAIRRKNFFFFYKNLFFTLPSRFFFLSPMSQILPSSRHFFALGGPPFPPPGHLHMEAVVGEGKDFLAFLLPPLPLGSPSHLRSVCKGKNTEVAEARNRYRTPMFVLHEQRWRAGAATLLSLY